MEAAQHPQNYTESGLSRMLRIYRKEPLISFVVTIGAVDAAIGGLSDHASLMTMGIGMVGMAVGMRLWQWQHRRDAKPQPQRAPIHVLPPAPPQGGLPPLSMSQKRRPK